MEVVSMVTMKAKTNAEKEALIKDFLSSGKSKTLWCKEKGIAYQTFYKWLQKSNPAQESVKFVAVKDKKNKPAPDVPEKKSVTIQNSNLLLEIGICKMRISDTTSLDLVVNVIKAVKPFV